MGNTSMRLESIITMGLLVAVVILLGSVIRKEMQRSNDWDKAMEENPAAFERIFSLDN